MTIRDRIGTLFGNRAGAVGAMDTLMKAYTDQDKFNGAVLVGRGGEVVFSKAYGLANREHHVPATTNTVFRIGSMTKPFTAIAIMQLVESGQIEVTDRLATFLPDYPNGERITIHHLLSNSSGIPDYIPMAGYGSIMTHRVTQAEIIALFRDEPLQFEPGAAFAYSNSNWVLLGLVIEQVTGKVYADVIHERIFAPAGMAHSGCDWEFPIIPQRATGYAETENGLANAAIAHESGMGAAGAIYSTVGDLYRWHRALREGKLLRPETRRQMEQPVHPLYAYGWERYRLHNRDVVGHSGGVPGFVSNFVQFHEEDAVVIALNNLGGGVFSEITRDLAAILFGESYQLPSARQFIAVDPALLADYAGEYQVAFYGRTFRLIYSVEGGKLMMILPGFSKSVVEALSETTFFGKSKGEVEMTFQRGADGRVDRVDMVWAGHPSAATRVS